ncbi:MAG: hypothetical protein IJ867_02515 [Clostridia bacterium]|nr:hypothetical protein [Clostridia bacterium]
MWKVDENIINVCERAFQTFIGNGLYIGLFLMAIVYIISFMKSSDRKERKIKFALGIYSVVVLILNLNPLFTKFITSVLKETDTYWRVYWLLPIGIDIAFVFTEMIIKKETKKDRIVLFVLLVCTIILSGNYMYNQKDSERFVKINNYYKVPENVLDIIFQVSEDNSEYKKLAGTEEFIVYTRQIDGTILLPEGRMVNGIYSDNSIVTIIENGNLKEICDYCVNNQCNYLVLNANREVPNEYILGYDMKKLYENAEYSLYKFNRILGD